MLKSRILLNVALLALVAALGFFVFYDESETDPHQLSSLDASTINSIEIQHRDRYIVLKKIKNKWRMTRPINIAANEVRIGTLLKFINTTSHAHYDVAEVDLSRFKLDKPRTTIRFGDASNDTLFEFGSANPINRMRYIRTGEKLHLIDDNFYPLVSSQLGTLVSLSLLPGIDAITFLRLPDLQLERSESGKWQLTPDDREISSDDINSLLDEWRYSQAFGVHDYLEREDLGKIDVVARNEGGTMRAHFVVTDIDPWLIIARPELGIEYHFNEEIYDRLFRPGNKLPDDIDAEDAGLDASTTGKTTN